MVIDWNTSMIFSLNKENFTFDYSTLISYIGYINTLSFSYSYKLGSYHLRVT